MCFKNFQEVVFIEQSENLKHTTRNWGAKLKQYFLKEDIQMIKQNMKMYSSSLSSGKLKIKMIMKYHLTLERKENLKKLETISVVGNAVKKKSSFSLGKNVL